MSEIYKISINSLQSGKTDRFEGKLDPSFLGIQEPELQFIDPVLVRGKAYIVDDFLMIHLSAKTFATMPCASCNQMKKMEILLENFRINESLDSFSGDYDFREALKEALLLELPQYLECEEGSCPEKKNLKPFIKKRSKDENKASIHYPFSQL